MTPSSFLFPTFIVMVADATEKIPAQTPISGNFRCKNRNLVP